MNNALFHKSKSFPNVKLLFIEIDFTIHIKFTWLDPRYLGMKYLNLPRGIKYFSSFLLI